MAGQTPLTGYSLHPEIDEDLFEIWSFIAEDNPLAADRVQARIRREFEAIAAMPFAGHAREDLTTRPLRFRVVYSYLIAYFPDRTPLPVLAVLHGRRNPTILAAILQGREEQWQAD